MVVAAESCSAVQYAFSSGGPQSSRKSSSWDFRVVIEDATMTDTTVIDRRPLRAPPRIDESTLSQPLRDLFATWRRALKDEFKGLTARGDVAHDLFPLRATGISAQSMIAAVGEFLSSLDSDQRAAVSFPVTSEVWLRSCGDR